MKDIVRVSQEVIASEAEEEDALIRRATTEVVKVGSTIEESTVLEEETKEDPGRQPQSQFADTGEETDGTPLALDKKDIQLFSTMDAHQTEEGEKTDALQKDLLLKKNNLSEANQTEKTIEIEEIVEKTDIFEKKMSPKAETTAVLEIEESPEKQPLVQPTTPVFNPPEVPKAKVSIDPVES